MRGSSILIVALVLASGCAEGSDGFSTGRDGGGDAADMLDSMPGGCTPACVAPQICVAGGCATPEEDEDSDGVPASRDCDDGDASVGSTAERTCTSDCGSGVQRCTDTVWAACTAPTDCDCTDESVARTIPCERCGQQRQVCTSGRWVDDGGCGMMGECSPGSMEDGGSCGCGTDRRVCTTECSWTEFECVGDCSCGDGACNGSETCGTCSMDCGACPVMCGDGTCGGGETCATCEADCGACPPMCGDGDCNADETCSTCLMDCGACPPSCGDGDCGGSETCTTCSMDCGPCPAMCGDGTCDATETCESCSDCQNGHLGTANQNGDSCAGVTPETWRCVTVPSGSTASQFCRGGTWSTFNLNPRDCGGCVCGFSSACNAP